MEAANMRSCWFLQTCGSKSNIVIKTSPSSQKNIKFQGEQGLSGPPGEKGKPGEPVSFIF